VPDAPAEHDELKRDTLAVVLASRLRRVCNEGSQASFLVHLDGQWGTGKTTLLNLLVRHLRRDFLLVRFDAWRNASVNPPWWALLTVLREHVSRQFTWWRRAKLRIEETFVRIRRSGAPYLLAMLLVVLAIGSIIATSVPKFSLSHLADLTKAVTTLAIGIGALWTSLLVASRFFLWESARGARLFEQSHTNPMQEVAQHFDWLIQHSSKPVLILIDDLDRCNEQYVVTFLDAVQTLVRDAPRDNQGAVGIVVAADGAWLRKAYETTYSSFTDAIEEPARSLGYLFLDKLFQLNVPMPAFGAVTQASYLDSLLKIVSPGERATTALNEMRKVKAQIKLSRTDSEVIHAVEEAPPKVRELVAINAVERINAPEVVSATERYVLQKFAPHLKANPRDLKRFINTYSVLRTVRTLEGIPVDSDALALWIVIKIHWPILADYLTTYPDALAVITENLPAVENLPDSVKRAAAVLGANQALKAELVQMTPDIIRRCSGTWVG